MDVVELKTVRRESERGTVLVASLIAFVMVLAFVLATLLTTQDKLHIARAGVMDLNARYVAQAGYEWQVHQIWTARNLANLGLPFEGIDALDSNATEGVGSFTEVFNAEPLLASDGTVIGEFATALDVRDRADSTGRDIDITVFGYVPTRAAFDSGDPSSSRVEVSGTIRVEFQPGSVFDYSYFINHWGWFYGDTIVCNGNARANGQFDFGGHQPFVNGSPRYSGANGTDLVGYIDDNGDGLQDGNDGGVYASWTIVNDSAVRGMGAQSQNQHEWQPYVPMPNLSDLGVYETLAASEGGSITVGGTTVVDGVMGDDPSEPQNVYLEGTAADPIVLNGPIVARGDVIIKGYVTGQGTIYSGRNVYIADDIVYVDGPTTSRPASNDQSTVEAWRAANAAKDALGLFAREHVVIGDYTDSSWQSYVSSWLNNSLNESEEDAGADGIQNTRNGPDGIYGTADDDVLEGDGVWTVDVYTSEDTALGLIPSGKSVGDPIPGTGEDIDGDGVYDARTAMSEFNLSATLDPSNWAGLSTSYGSYHDVSSIYFERSDGNLYTNHFLAALMLAWNGSTWTDIQMNGSIVSRNESLVYGANWIYMNHDERLSGGDGASNFGLYLPMTWSEIEDTAWTVGAETSGGMSAYTGI
ncbi:MAG: hypothetical protein KDC38_05940 [Planctomycetes bacterium]|nr:hypothetical protein [Planctomycetota bacterium]